MPFIAIEYNTMLKHSNLGEFTLIILPLNKFPIEICIVELCQHLHTLLFNIY